MVFTCHARYVSMLLCVRCRSDVAVWHMCHICVSMCSVCGVLVVDV